MKKDVYVVKVGSYHPWLKSKIVYEGKTKEECQEWIYENLTIGQHAYVDKVTKYIKED